MNTYQKLHLDYNITIQFITTYNITIHFAILKNTIGNLYKYNLQFKLMHLANLCIEGLYEVTLLTQVEAVKADEPVRRWDNLRDNRYLRKSMSPTFSLSSTNHAVVAVDKDIGGSVADTPDDWRSKDRIEKSAVA